MRVIIVVIAVESKFSLLFGLYDHSNNDWISPKYLVSLNQTKTIALCYHLGNVISYDGLAQYNHVKQGLQFTINKYSETRI